MDSDSKRLPLAKTCTDAELAQKRLKSHQRMTELEHHLLICMGKCCLKRGADEIYDRLKQEQQTRNWGNRLRINSTGECMGRCGDHCPIAIYPEGTWYMKNTVETALFLAEHLVSEAEADDRLQISYTFKEGQFRRSPSYPL